MVGIWNTRFLLGWPIFRGNFNFGECNYLTIYMLHVGKNHQPQQITHELDKKSSVSRSNGWFWDSPQRQFHFHRSTFTKRLFWGDKKGPFTPYPSSCCTESRGSPTTPFFVGIFFEKTHTKRTWTLFFFDFCSDNLRSGPRFYQLIGTNGWSRSYPEHQQLQQLPSRHPSNRLSKRRGLFALELKEQSKVICLIAVFLRLQGANILNIKVPEWNFCQSNLFTFHYYHQKQQWHLGNRNM